MLKTDVLKELGGFEESFTGSNQMYEDQPLLAKFYLTQPVFISADCNNKYRQRYGSLVQKVKAAGQYDLVRLYFLRWLQGYMDQHCLKHPQAQAALAKALLKYKYPNLFRFARFIKQKLHRPAHG
jgi:hypothetical protein